jgi:hypothetical protein
MRDVVTVLSSAAFSTALTATLLFLAKTWISERLKNEIKFQYDTKLELHKAVQQNDLERYKAELQGNAERLKSELAISAAENQIRFTKLHETVADVVAELYARLFGVLMAFADYVSLYEHDAMGSKEERRKTLEHFPFLRSHVSQCMEAFSTSMASRAPATNNGEML